MTQDITGQVLSVVGRPVKNDNTIYDVAFSDGNKYSTFKAEIATKANGLVGQPVTARVSVTQNGKYTNYTLEDVGPVGSLPALAMPAAPGAPLTGAPAQTPPPPIPMQQNNGGMAPEREARIVKQSCLSTAFNFVGALFTSAGPEAFEEAKTLALDLAKELYAQVQGGATENTPQTPQEIAASIPGVTVGVPPEAPATSIETPPKDSQAIPW